MTGSKVLILTHWIYFPAQFKNQAFQVIRNDGSIVLLPLETLEELSNIPASIASPNSALEHDLLGPYTGLNLILESRVHHSIVQRRLTPRLGLMVQRLEQEIKAACDQNIGSSEDWTEFQPYKALSKVSARIAAQAIMCTDFSHNPTWLEISVEYTESCKPTYSSPLWAEHSLRPCRTIH
jgi:ent-kaurene oxidase